MSRLAILALLIAVAPLPIAFTAATGGVTATRVPLDPRDPAARDVGRLRFVGGWALTGGDRRFGGVSSMTIASDGVFTLLSDGGVATRFRFSGDGVQTDYAMRELPDGPGDRWRKVNRDSESSTRDPATGTIWVGFETRNEIWRYAPGFARATGHVAPQAMAGWPQNEGAESLVRLSDGRFLAIAETEKRPDGSHVALLFPGDPVTGAAPVTIGIRGPGGYAPTDAAELPDGRVLMLLRRFAPARGVALGAPGFAAALVMFDPRGARDGTTLSSRPVAMLAPPLSLDNMEALAVERCGDRTIVWIASDDNFLPIERTLLLAFELRPGI